MLIVGELDTDRIRQLRDAKALLDPVICLVSGWKLPDLNLLLLVLFLSIGTRVETNQEDRRSQTLVKDSCWPEKDYEEVPANTVDKHSCIEREPGV